jgi:hypothetical protein
MGGGWGRGPGPRMILCLGSRLVARLGSTAVPPHTQRPPETAAVVPARQLHPYMRIYPQRSVQRVANKKTCSMLEHLSNLCYATRTPLLGCETPPANNLAGHSNARATAQQAPTVAIPNQRERSFHRDSLAVESAA